MDEVGECVKVNRGNRRGNSQLRWGRSLRREEVQGMGQGTRFPGLFKGRTPLLLEPVEQGRRRTWEELTGHLAWQQELDGVTVG